MTISTEPAQLSYDGDDSTDAFPVTWNYFAKSHVVATLRDSSDVETLWVLDTDYTLTDADLGSGTLTATTPPATGETLVINLDPPNTQDKSLPIGGAVPTPQIEDGFDIAAQRDAKLEALLNRAILVPTTDSQIGSMAFPIDATRASMLLAFDENGAPTIADFIDSIFVNQESAPVTDGTLYLWQKTSTGDLYFLKSAAWVLYTALVVGVDVQAYDAATALTDEDQAWTGSQRAATVTDNDGSFDMDAGQDFQWTPAGADTLEFTNETQGQRGMIRLVNPSGHAISLGAEIKAGSSAATNLSVAGTYDIAYWCYDGTNVDITYSGALV